jgi:3-hydroxybutyrate dehydrogenase
MSLKRVAAVTGGSSGIGLSIVKRLQVRFSFIAKPYSSSTSCYLFPSSALFHFATCFYCAPQRLGYAAISWDIQAPADSSIPFVNCDVSSEAKVAAALSETVGKLGASPSVLINNCGLQYMAPVTEFPLEKWNTLLGIMVTGTFLCSKAVIPGAGWPVSVLSSFLTSQPQCRISLVLRNAAPRLGPNSQHILYSRQGSVTFQERVCSHFYLVRVQFLTFSCRYVTSKHAVLGLSKVMALETAAHGITVNSICPGFVDTPLMRAQIKKQAELNKMSEDDVATQIMLKPACIKKFTTVDQVAAFVEFLVSDDASTITGEAFSQSGGWGMGR